MFDARKYFEETGKVYGVSTNRRYGSGVSYEYSGVCVPYEFDRLEDAQEWLEDEEWGISRELLSREEAAARFTSEKAFAREVAYTTRERKDLEEYREWQKTQKFVLFPA